jgi:nitrogen fixation NifU-like protein
MVADDAQKMYQSFILDHGRSPRGYGVLVEYTHKAAGFNRLCGDRIEVFLQLADDRIRQAGFSGESCAVCKASASMLMETLPGLNRSEVAELLALLRRFTEDWQVSEELGAFQAFQVMQEFPTRLKCLQLPWKTAEAALAGEGATVSTEPKQK